MPSLPAKELLFPQGGIVRSMSYQRQAPYTCYDALNVWPREPGQSRVRGGKRPGLAMYSPNSTAAVSPHSLLELVRVKKYDGNYDYRSYSFDDSTLGGAITLANLSSTSLPSIENKMAYAAADSTTNRSIAVPTNLLTDFDPTQSFRFGVYVVPYQDDEEYAHTIRLYFAMTSLASVSNCYYLSFVRTNSASGWTLRFYHTGTVNGATAAGPDTAVGTLGSSSSIQPAEGWLEIEISGTTAKAFWRGEECLSKTLPAALGATNSRLGVMLQHPTNGGARTQIKEMAVQYQRSSNYELLRPIIIKANTNGVLQRETYRSKFTNTTSTLTVNGARRIKGKQIGDKLYIADHSEPIISGVGTGSIDATSFSATGISDFSASLTGYGSVDLVLHVTSENGAGSYAISSVGTGTLGITDGPIISYTTDVDWRIERSPKRYIPETDTLELWRARDEIIAAADDGVIETDEDADPDVTYFTSGEYPYWISLLTGLEIGEYSLEIFSSGVFVERFAILEFFEDRLVIDGVAADDDVDLEWRIVRTTNRPIVPVGCFGISRYRGRAVLYGDPLDPNEVYMSRIGDETDWEFGNDDSGAAVKFSASEACEVGDAVKAFIPYADQYALIACRSSVWRLTGDPVGGGSISAISYTIGIATTSSWCQGEKVGEVFILSRDGGLYATSINCPSCELVRVSGLVIPQELVGIKDEQTEVAMVYDVDNRLIHIFLCPKESGVDGTRSVHWVFDVDTKGFFKQSFARRENVPAIALWYPGLSEHDSGVLLSTKYGDLVRFSPTALRDCANRLYSVQSSSTTISNYILLGPMPLGVGPRDFGSVDEISAVLAYGSEDVDYEIYTGRTAEEAVLNAVAGTSPAASGTFSSSDYGDISDYPRVQGGAYVLKIIGSSTGYWAMESIPVSVTPLGTGR
jgi:hypothetical protein